MRPMSNFEKKFGKYAINNLPLILILCYACGYLLNWIQPTILNYLTLDPCAILHGQVWRLVSWVIIPPSSFDFFTLLMLYVYYSLARSLEQYWGTYRLNVYLLTGILYTVLGSFLLLGVQAIVLQSGVGDLSYLEYSSSVLANYFSTYYVNMSIFLAFAVTFPDIQMLLFFIIPIKVKYLGVVYGAILIYDFIRSGVSGKVVIGASLLNFIIYFISSRRGVRLKPKQRKQRQEFKRDVKMASRENTVHKCAVCGRTNEEFPELEFRYCSKCAGNYEYCQDHIFTHTHVK